MRLVLRVAFPLEFCLLMAVGPMPACSVELPFSISRGSLLAAASAHDDASSTSFLGIHCDVFEGPNCYRVDEEHMSHSTAGDGYFQHPLPRDLSKQMIDEIGAKYVEHSQYNTVLLRCRGDIAVHPSPSCELSRGEGQWKRLLVYNGPPVEIAF